MYTCIDAKLDIFIQYRQKDNKSVILDKNNVW